MPGTAKKILIWLLFLWLAGLLLTCILLPRFHRNPPAAEAIGAHEPGQTAQERILCVDDNQEALIRRLQMIEAAEKKIVLSTYYLGCDDSGRDVMSALLAAADRGVSIRLLVDGFCNFTVLRSSPVFKALVESPMVEAKIYNPVNLIFPWKLNYRMHDKYLIVDDQMYILGGRNTRNVSLGDYQEKQDIDRDILVWSEEGKGSLLQVSDYFESVWALPESKPVKTGKKPHTDGKNHLKERYAALPERYPEAFEPVDFRELTAPADRITLLHNPIRAENKQPLLWAQLRKLMETGKDVLVQTPYIVCDRMMYGDLQTLTEQGTQMRIITNAPEYGANPCGCADLMNHRGRLRKTGAEIWEYAGGKSVHAKSVLIDDTVSVVGSFNFDMRSTYLDTEMMLVIESRELNEHLRDMDQQYLQSSRRQLANGERLTGALYRDTPVGIPRRVLHGVLRVLTLPLRHLL